jgi:uncharacterized damage-inducible protein DinB
MDNKTLVKHYIEEIRMETVSARKCIERVPESTYKFKPHEKSMEMGYLVLLVADIPKWISSMIKLGEIDFATWERVQPTTTKAMVEYYDKNVEGAIEALENITEEQMKGEFALKNQGQLLFSAPKMKNIGETINHWVHHRGQLTVYMRLNDIAVPSIYGPSADEKGF